VASVRTSSITARFSMHCSELPNSQLTTVLHHRPRLKRRMFFLSYGLWQIHYKRAPRSVMAVGSRRCVSKGTVHVILSRKANCPIWQIFGILGSAPYEKFTKGQRLALSTILFKYYLPAPSPCVPEANWLGQLFLLNFTRRR